METRSLEVPNSRLRDEFDGLFPAEQIDEVFRQSTDELTQEASVENFVLLFAERRARVRLAQLARS